MFKTNIKTDIEFKVGIYIRLSREDGDDLESESVSNQRDLLQEYISENNYIFYKEYIDDGFSGGNYNRPAFKNLIKDIEDKKINMVITKDLSRLGRDYIDTGHYVERYFPENKVRYISLLDNIDTYYDNVGNEMMPFKSVMNDMYAKDISKKVKSVLRNKKKQGLYLGSTAPYGYKKDPNNKYKLIIDEETKKIVEVIFKLYLSGKTMGDIAYKLTSDKIDTPSIYKNKNANKNIWTISSVSNILKNKVYTGCLVQNVNVKINYKTKKRRRTDEDEWIIFDDSHEAIIDKITFEIVNNTLDKNKKRITKNNYLLEGLLFCKDCNHSMCISNDKKNNKTFILCNYYKKYSKHNLCTTHYYNYIKLEENIINIIKNKIKKTVDNYTIKQTINNNLIDEDKVVSEKIMLINKQIINNKEKIERLYEDRLNDIINIETYKRLSIKIEEDIYVLKDKINELNKKFKNKLINSKENKVSELYDNFINNYLISKNIIKQIIDKIYVHEDKTIEIIYKINI